MNLFPQRTIFKTFNDFVEGLNNSAEKTVLGRLLSLYGGNLVLKHIGHFYQGGFLTGPQSKLYENGILNILSQLKNDGVSLVDAVSPPDFVLNSPLGASDGNVYANLEGAITQSPEVFERPKWWRDVLHLDGYVKAKL